MKSKGHWVENQRSWALGQALSLPINSSPRWTRFPLCLTYLFSLVISQIYLCHLSLHSIISFSPIFYSYYWNVRQLFAVKRRKKKSHLSLVSHWDMWGEVAGIISSWTDFFLSWGRTGGSGCTLHRLWWALCFRQWYHSGQQLM